MIFMGDSAGGGLGLGLSIALRDAGKALPAKLILFAPWVDLTAASPETAAQQKNVGKCWYPCTSIT